MRYLLDTNHCSYVQRGNPQVIKHMMSLSEDDRIDVSVVAQGELLAGIQQTRSERRRVELQALYDSLMADTADVLIIDTEVAEHYAQVLSQLLRKGRPIPSNDMWIAATALAHDVVLVTADAHFSQIDGLRLEDWSLPGRPQP